MQADSIRVPVGPGSIHVERYGHGGIGIILLHGFGTSGFLWRNVAPVLAEAGHTAYAVDMFGYGESDRPFDSDFGIAAQAEYLDAAMTSLRVAKGVIVGVDVGGVVALRLAATRPERVQRMVLINTPAFDELPPKDITTMQRSTAKFAVRVTRGVLGAAPLLQSVLEGGVADPAKMPMKLVARYLAAYAGENGVQHLLTLARSVRREDFEDLDLSSIHVPTLVVWGDQDKWLDPKLPDRLVNAIPDSRLTRVHGVGRLVPEESPEQLCEILLGFIRAREQS